MPSLRISAIEIQFPVFTYPKYMVEALRYNQKVAGSIPEGIIGIFY